jgi:hypothetical protein
VSPKETREFIDVLENRTGCQWSRGILAEMEKLEKWKASYGPPSKHNIERAAIAIQEQALCNLYKRMKKDIL